MTNADLLAELSEATVNEIVARWKKGEPYLEIAESLGLSGPQILAAIKQSRPRRLAQGIKRLA